MVFRKDIAHKTKHFDEYELMLQTPRFSPKLTEIFTAKNILILINLKCLASLPTKCKRSIKTKQKC